mgnify:CR=1 FL=1
MSKPVVEVKVRAVLPAAAGSAIFLASGRKIIVIYVDPSVAAAITMFMRHTPKDRPLTHDLMVHVLTALGARVERVIVNDVKSGAAGKGGVALWFEGSTIAHFANLKITPR